MNITRFKNKKIAIWGLGQEGLSALRFLRNHIPNQPIDILSDTPIPVKQQNEIKEHFPIQFYDINDYPYQNVDIVVKSPGISLYHPIISLMQKEGVKITSPTNLWYSNYSPQNIIAVTGTKGKSTTTALIDHLLKGLGFKTVLAGNMGKPVLDIADKNPTPDYWILELSSYQTSDINFSPDYGILLNLFPEHIDWHKSHEQYYLDKLALFKHSQGSPILINAQDTKSVELTKNHENIHYFNHENGFLATNHKLYFKNSPIFDDTTFSIPGEHNLVNLSAALTLIDILNIPFDKSLPLLKSFQGLPHRLNTVYKDEYSRQYIDDSLSTTPETAIAAIESLDKSKLTLLLGGYDRKQDYSLLAQKIIDYGIPTVITMYETGPQIAETILGLNPSKTKVIETKDLETAINAAKQNTVDHGIILLSPAAPSYDAFDNFKQRGIKFKEYSTRK